MLETKPTLQQSLRLRALAPLRWNSSASLRLNQKPTCPEFRFSHFSAER